MLNEISAALRGLFLGAKGNPARSAKRKIRLATFLTT